MCQSLSDLNESEVLISIDQFIQSIYTQEVNTQQFKSDLNKLIPMFQKVYRSGLKYSTSLVVFQKMLNDLAELFGAVTLNCVDELKDFQIRYLINNALCYAFNIKDELISFKLQEKRNQKSLSTYISQLTQHYSKLLFIRIDLAIIKESQPIVDIQQFNHYLRLFLNRIQNQDTCFQDLQGYAWAIEQGEQKGYHCHVLLIYDGHKHQQDYGIGMRVGECWKNLTEDKGCFFLSNTPEYKKRFEQKGTLGIGMTHRNNPKQVQNAINTAMYLVNPEKDNQYLRVKVKGMRTFGKGVYDVNWRRQYHRSTGTEMALES